MPIGRSIPTDLVQAIEARENLFKSDEKTPDSIKFTHGRSSFAVVRSLVKVDDSYDLAKSAVLSSGTGITGRAGIDRESDKNLSNSEAAYYQSEVYGFRPMPGITNINSTVLGGYGAVRKTTIGFKANSLADLNILSTVYMHFGATLLVEFGHTVYVSKDGEIKNMTLGDLVNSKDLYTSKPTLGKIRKLIYDLSSDKNYNYEGIVGYVDNFDFSFNEDGTYDCSVSIKSHNGVTDSLTVPSVIDNISNFKTATEEGEPEGDVARGCNNLIDLVCSGLEKYNKSQGKVNLKTLFDDVGLSNFGQWTSNYHAYVSTIPVEGPVAENEVSSDTTALVEGDQLIFLPLRFWLALFNVYAMPRTDGSIEGQLVRWSMQSNSWRAYKFMYSHNPGMVQLSRKATGTTAGYNVKGSRPTGFISKAENYRGADLLSVNESGNTQILDIRVSNKLMRRVNDNFIANNPKKNDEIGLTDFVDLLLDEIQKYMGNINSFEIATAPRPGGDNGTLFSQLEIYDKSIRPSKGATLNLSGLSTTVTKVGIKSNVSNNIQVAAMLGGAGKKGGGGKTQAGIELYNQLGEAASDALVGQAFTNTTPSVDSEGEEPAADDPQGKRDIRDIIQELYDAWNAGEGNQFEKILDSSQQYAQSLVGGKALGRYMPIPVDVDIEMLGMGGFKNLETFSLPDHLVTPRLSSAKANFIIMGVEHTLDSSDSMWKTSITAKLKPN